MTALTALVVLWIILGIVLGIMEWGWVVMLGLAVEVFIGGYLLRRWGKSYIERD